jgi:hypothetical protein
MMAGWPDSLLASASDRNNKLNPAFRFTPPWQDIHFLLKMGFTSVLKSTALRLVLKVKTPAATTIKIISQIIFLDKRERMASDFSNSKNTTYSSTGYIANHLLTILY